MPANDRPPHQPRLVFGVLLLALGLGLLAAKFGVSLPWDLWKYFPVPLIALGIWGLVQPTRYLDRDGGLWILTAGLYCLIGVFGLFGLSWGSAWPIYIIATGVSVMMDRGARSCSIGDSRRADDR